MARLRPSSSRGRCGAGARAPPPGGPPRREGSPRRRAREPAPHLPRLEEGRSRAMIAYKFLTAGAAAPFTGRPWPLPGPRAPGAWIVAPQGDLARYGVHACRVEDLSYWPD